MTSSRQTWMLGAFLVVNAALILGAAPGAAYVHGGDAALYAGPAMALWRDGVLSTSLSDPTPLSFAPPLYPVFLAPLLGPLPFDAALAVVVCLQAAMLWLTGVTARDLLPRDAAGPRDLLQALVAFNPNALFTAHLVQAETLFTLIATLAMVAMAEWMRSPSPRGAARVGLLVGLSALVRPVALFAVPLLLLLLPALALLDAPGWRRLRALVPQALLAAAVAAALVAPWLARNAVVFGQPFFTTNAGFYLSDQYVELLQVSTGMPGAEASALRYERIAAVARASGIEDLDALPAPARSAFTAAAVGPLLLEQPASAWARAFARSWANLFASGGASNAKNLLGLEGGGAAELLSSRRWDGPVAFARQFLSQPGTAYLLLVVATAAFAALARLAGIVGVVRMLFAREHAMVALLVGEVAFFTASYVFLGQSRFRVPLEPALMVLATWSIASPGRAARPRAAPSPTGRPGELA